MPVRPPDPRQSATAERPRSRTVRGAKARVGDGSADVIRRTLPLMSRHAAGYSPDSYALWFEYVRGGNSALRAELESALGEHARLSHELTFELHRRHVADRSEEVARETGASLLELMSEVGRSVGHAGAASADFDARLAAFVEGLEADGPRDAMRRQVAAIRDEVDRMNRSLAELDSRLAAGHREVVQLQQALQRARDEASLDPLTGILNRRGFDAAIRSVFAEAVQDGMPFSVVMVDIDHFKRINDGYGHPFGDQVIRAVGQALSQLTQRRDIAARYGGEEFALVLPETRLQGARDVAERLRIAVSRGYITRGAGRTPIGSITVSAGVAQHVRGETAIQVVARADDALHESKRSGRNRVSVAR
jgi:diguanylate cyclase